MIENNMNATKSIAASACSMRTGGLFDTEVRAANHVSWRIAA